MTGRQASKPPSPPLPSELRVLNLDEVAELLRCSRQHVYALNRKEGLPFTRLGGRTVVRASELDGWLRQHTERAS